MERGPTGPTTRTVLLSDSALLLEAPGSGNTPRAEVRTATDILVSGYLANQLARSHRHSEAYTARRRLTRPTRARPRSPFRRGSAHVGQSTPLSAAAQSEFPRSEAEYFHAGEGGPSELPGGSRRYPSSTWSAFPTGRWARRVHVHANRDLATLLCRDRDRSTGPRHLPRAGPFGSDLEG